MRLIMPSLYLRGKGSTNSERKSSSRPPRLALISREKRIVVPRQTALDKVYIRSFLIWNKRSNVRRRGKSWERCVRRGELSVSERGWHLASEYILIVVLVYRQLSMKEGASKIIFICIHLVPFFVSSFSTSPTPPHTHTLPHSH